MPQEEVLIVEDHQDIVEILEFHLHQGGYKTLVARDGTEGHRKALERTPNLILLDIMLPGMSGFEVCRALRQRPETKSIPIIMLTAKGEEGDIVKGLELGADDYVTKPFGAKELLARVKAVLRRKNVSAPPHSKSLQAGPIEINIEKHEIKVSGKKLSLTPSEFGILQTVATRPGRVYTRDQLLEKLRGPDLIVVDRNIDVHVASLRKKLGEHSKLIETVRGIGYRFAD